MQPACISCAQLPHNFQHHVPRPPPGFNELQCRVADHVWAGMRATYYVAPNPSFLDSVQLSGKRFRATGGTKARVLGMPAGST